MATTADLADVERFAKTFRATIGEVVLGQPGAISHLAAALLCGGHVLLSGGAATAKGLLVQAVARVTRLDFRRIQFTPDLMPSDITGAEMLGGEGGARAARFVPGPVFANLVLADEINRTPPKTQAALLEAMQERQVTSGGVSRPLPAPFFVMATRTATETEGTYPLPEAQQDRFMLNIDLPALDVERAVRVMLEDPAARLPELAPVIDGERLQALQQAVRAVRLGEATRAAIVALSGATRPDQPQAAEVVRRYVAWGAGVRASQCLALGAKAMAAMDGRDEATPADARAVLEPVMRHRIGLNFHAANDRLTPERLLHELLAERGVAQGAL